MTQTETLTWTPVETRLPANEALWGVACLPPEAQRREVREACYVPKKGRWFLPLHPGIYAEALRRRALAWGPAERLPARNGG